MVKVKINDKVFEFDIQKPSQEIIDGNFLIAKCYEYKGGELVVDANYNYTSVYSDYCYDGIYDDYETEELLYDALIEFFNKFCSENPTYAGEGTVSKVYHLKDNKAFCIAKSQFLYAELIMLQKECKQFKIEILD